jgi:hypothetical protein
LESLLRGTVAVELQTVMWWGPTATVLAALIAAGLGGFGGAWYQARLRRESERSDRRELLKRRYFFQLQDATQSLWYRLNNLANESGRSVMADDYYATTTLYALGRVLALERIFALEGIYPELQSLYTSDDSAGLGEFLRDRSLNRKLQAVYEYHRLALAEAIIESDGDGYRVSTFGDFRAMYESSEHTARDWFQPALQVIESETSLSDDTIEDAMRCLKEVAHRMSEETGVPSPLEKNESPRCPVPSADAGLKPTAPSA